MVAIELHLPAHPDEALAVELTASLPEESRPYSLYVSFPASVEEGWRASFRLLDVEAHLDEEQIDGTSRDWITADSYAVWDSHVGIRIDCPSVPLVMPSGFGFGRMSTRVPRAASPLVLAWVANNYWDTNFPASQPGFLAAGWWLQRIAPGDHAVSRKSSYRDMLAHPVVVSPSDIRQLSLAIPSPSNNASPTSHTRSDHNAL
jgi:hypothetical protein